MRSKVGFDLNIWRMSSRTWRSDLSILGSCLVAFTVSSASGPAMALGATPIIDSFVSIVEVVARQDIGRLAKASGVVLGQHRGEVWVATNFHVTGYSQASGIQVIHQGITLAVRRQVCRSILDLCLLAIDRPQSSPALSKVALQFVRAEQLKIGQKMISRGRIRGTDIETSGHLEISFPYAESQILRSPDVGFIMGMSGGGVYDEAGRLIALNSAIVKGSARFAYFMLPTNWIKSLLDNEDSLDQYHDFDNDFDVPYFDPRLRALRPFFFQASWLEVNGQWAELKTLVAAAKAEGHKGTGYFEGQLKARGM